MNGLGLVLPLHVVALALEILFDFPQSVEVGDGERFRIAILKFNVENEHPPPPLSRCGGDYKPESAGHVARRRFRQYGQHGRGDRGQPRVAQPRGTRVLPPIEQRCVIDLAPRGDLAPHRGRGRNGGYTPAPSGTVARGHRLRLIPSRPSEPASHEPPASSRGARVVPSGHLTACGRPRPLLAPWPCRARPWPLAPPPPLVLRDGRPGSHSGLSEPVAGRSGAAGSGSRPRRASRWFPAPTAPRGWLWTARAVAGPTARAPGRGLRRSLNLPRRRGPPPRGNRSPRVDGPSRPGVRTARCRTGTARAACPSAARQWAGAKGS